MVQDCANQPSAGFHVNLPAPHLEKCVFASCAASWCYDCFHFCAISWRHRHSTSRAARSDSARSQPARHSTLGPAWDASLRRGMPRVGRRILNRHGTARSEPARCDRHGTPRGASANPGSVIQDSGSRICAPGSRIQVPGSRLLDPGSCIQDPGTGTAR